MLVTPVFDKEKGQKGQKVDLTVDSLDIFHPGHVCLLCKDSATPQKFSFQITYIYC